MLLFLPSIWFSSTWHVNQRDAAFTSRIQQNNHLRAPFAGSLWTLVLFPSRGGGRGRWGLCPPQYIPSYWAPFNADNNMFTPAISCVLGLVDAHTGAGKAIVSNCRAQDFDYTLALKAQDCKRTIARRAPSSRRCNFSPFLMREHIKR